MYQVLILFKDKNITIEDETNRIRNKTRKCSCWTFSCH